MHEPQFSSPQSPIDVTSDGEQETETAPQNKTHGGARNTKRYGDKLLALEAPIIRNFLAEQRCYCGKNCLLKLSYKGEEAQRILYNLRARRFESECPISHNGSAIPHP